MPRAQQLGSLGRPEASYAVWRSSYSARLEASSFAKPDPCSVRPHPVAPMEGCGRQTYRNGRGLPTPKLSTRSLWLTRTCRASCGMHLSDLGAMGRPGVCRLKNDLSTLSWPRKVQASRQSCVIPCREARSSDLDLPHPQGAVPKARRNQRHEPQRVCNRILLHASSPVLQQSSLQGCGQRAAINASGQGGGESCISVTAKRPNSSV